MVNVRGAVGRLGLVSPVGCATIAGSGVDMFCLRYLEAGTDLATNLVTASAGSCCRPAEIALSTAWPADIACAADRLVITVILEAEPGGFETDDAPIVAETMGGQAFERFKEYV
ncbi:hypothetical protein GCM10029992_54040 [Glycomyces albus]